MKCPFYVYVMPFFPSPASWRGAYGYDFVRALERTGRYRVVVVTEGDGSPYRVGDVTVQTFRAAALPGGVFPFLFQRRNEDRFLDALRRAGVDLAEVACCHGNTANYGIYPLALKRVNPACRTLLHHHDLASFGLNRGRLRHCWLYNLYLCPVLRRMHEQFDGHVFCSEASRRSFLSVPDARWTAYADYRRQMRGLPYRPARIGASLILHNGVDPRLFAPLPKPAGAEPGTGPLVLGCIANYHPLKDHRSLLEAMVLLRDRGVATRLVSVGSGETLGACRRFAAEHGLDVDFRSEVRHEALPRFYHELDLFVLPSVFEGFGCVYTEAHASGVPFIACEGQGTDDLIPAEDRARWLCRVRDPADLADKIAAYARNRWTQRLTENQDIDFLVGRFVEQLEAL